MPRRDKLEITEKILQLLSAKNGKKPTHLMYKANLSHGQMKKYLKELTKKELIKKENANLAITQKGKKFLEKIKEMREFESVFGLKN